MTQIVADPGFPWGEGGANSKGGREKLLLGNFFPKILHEIGIIWTSREGMYVPGVPLDPPMTKTCNYSVSYLLLVGNSSEHKETNILYICLTSLTRAKLNNKMAFPA